LTTFPETQAREFVAARRAAGRPSGRSLRSLAPVLAALAGARVLAPDSPVAASAQERLLAAFGEYLRCERALATATTGAYVARARRFLAGLGGGLDGLTAADVTAAVLAEAETLAAGSATQCQMSVAVEPVPPVLRSLHDVARRAYDAGLAALRPGRFLELAAAMARPVLDAGHYNMTPMVHSLAPAAFVGHVALNAERSPATAGTADRSFRHSYRPSSKGTFHVDTPGNTPI
jgi:hypothetical protein